MTSDKALPQAKPARPFAIELLILLGLGFAVFFCFGVASGYFGAHKGGALTGKDYAVAGTTAAIAALCLWQIVVRTIDLIRKPKEKTGPKMRRVRNLWIFFISLGLALGVMSSLTSIIASPGEPGSLVDALFETGPISPAIAIILLAGLAVTTIATVIYYRDIDEHELAVQSFASLVAINVYIILEAGWWIAAKAKIAPAMNHGAIFFAVLAAWTAVWLWRRYR